MAAATEKKSTATIVGCDVVAYMVARGNSRLPPTTPNPPNQYAGAMRDVVEELIDEHAGTFDGISRQVQSEQHVSLQAIRHVFDEMLAEGTPNWGRLSTLYAFGAYIAMSTDEDENEDERSSVQMTSSTTMGDFLGAYVDEKLEAWIRAQGGGWDGFIGFVEARSPASAASHSVLGDLLFLWAGFNTITSGLDPSHSFVFYDVLAKALPWQELTRSSVRAARSMMSVLPGMPVPSGKQ